MTNSIGPDNPFVEFARSEIDQTIPDRFERQVALWPDRIAVKAQGQSLTYAELNRMANAIAQAVVKRVGPGLQPVGLLIEPGVQAVAALMGLLKAGKIWVPLDPSQPAARLEHLAADAGLVLVLGDRATSLLPPAWPTPVASLDLDSVSPHLSDLAPPRHFDPDSPAFILYTSGSTGQPKGVPQTHRNILHAIRLHTNSLHLCADDRLVLLTAYNHLTGSTATFRALLNGAAVYPYYLKREGLAGLTAWLRAEEITVYQSVPTVFRRWVETLRGDPVLPRLRLIHLGGEPVSRRDVESYQTHFAAHALLMNNLGSTEVYSYRQFFMDGATRLDSSLVPVGYPLEDKKVIILDEGGQALPAGQVGEIAVRSRYLTPGYWRRPDLTEAAFTPPAADGTRIFRTGDLGRLEPDGCLFQLGRRDSQVKVNGWRVELAEIEMAVLEHPALKEAAVAAEPTEAGSELVAYLAPRQEPAPSFAEMRSFLRDRLPEAMVPSAFVVLPALPYLPNGKLDRRALAAANHPRLRPEAVGEAAQTSLEATLSELWREALDLPAVGRHDGFFELGGHSLLSMSLVSRMEAALGRPLPTTVLAEYPTVARLAEALTEQKLAASSTLVPLHPQGSRRPFFFLPGLGGGVLDFGELAGLLGDDQPVYGLLAQGHDGRLPPHDTIESLAAHAVGDLRRVQPAGPYHLGGYSFGGVVAYEAARQLRLAGEPVALLAVFDGYAPRRSIAQEKPWTNPRRWVDLLALLPYWLLDFAQQTRQDGWDHPRRMLRQLPSRLFPGRKIDLEEFVDAPDALPAHTRAIMALHLRASRDYQPLPYDGVVTLLRAHSQSLTRTPDPRRGWGRLAGGGVVVRYITGSHDNILVQPHVRSLAAALRASLDACQVTPTALQ